MKTFLISLGVIFVTYFVVYNQTLAGQELKLPVVKVIDGDTIETELVLPYPLNEIKIRIIGIDTPEMPAASYYETGKLGRADCDLEAKRALKARDYVQSLVDESLTYMIITDYKWDKFGGRIDGVVYLVNKQTKVRVNVGDMLIEKGLAVPYDGGTKTANWCAISPL
jgi:endonuclease YncB( thermonuclease family)